MSPPLFLVVVLGTACASGEAALDVGAAIAECDAYVSWAVDSAREAQSTLGWVQSLEGSASPVSQSERQMVWDLWDAISDDFDSLMDFTEERISGVDSTLARFGHYLYKGPIAGCAELLVGRDLEELGWMTSNTGLQSFESGGRTDVVLQGRMDDIFDEISDVRRHAHSSLAVRMTHNDGRGDSDWYDDMQERCAPRGNLSHDAVVSHCSRRGAERARNAYAEIEASAYYLQVVYEAILERAKPRY